MDRARAKAAGLASGLGAIVLGVGLGLLAPEALRPHALPILAVGAMVHGAGMTIQHRMETRESPAANWERALFWSCWGLLAALAGWLGLGLLVA